MNILTTPSGIEPATFRLVAQWVFDLVLRNSHWIAQRFLILMDILLEVKHWIKFCTYLTMIVLFFYHTVPYVLFYYRKSLTFCSITFYYVLFYYVLFYYHTVPYVLFYYVLLRFVLLRFILLSYIPLRFVLLRFVLLSYSTLRFQDSKLILNLTM